jgi:hypothetical protein
MLGGPEAQLTRRGIHFQVAGGSLGWQVAVRCLINGNRRSDDWLGIHFFRSRVSAVRYLVRVFRFGCRCRKIPDPNLVLKTRT